MNSSIRILQVMCGDAIIIKHNKRNIIIDGGYFTTYAHTLKPQLKAIKEKKEVIDLWILTHLDADHINGCVSFLRDSDIYKIGFLKELWFNCFNHFKIRGEDHLVSVHKGIEIRDYVSANCITLNQRVMSGLYYESDQIYLEVLSPNKNTFLELEEFWRKEEAAYHKKKNLKLVSHKSGNDYNEKIEILNKKASAKARKKDITNRSSITFFLMLEKKCILFLGDSYFSEIAEVLRLKKEKLGKRIPVDCIKLAHHGSRLNFDPLLLEYVECSNFIISSNGNNQHYLPDKQTLAKILCHPQRNISKQINFVFNYSNPLLRSIFKVDRKAKEIHNFKCSYPIKHAHYYDIKL